MLLVLVSWCWPKAVCWLLAVLFLQSCCRPVSVSSSELQLVWLEERISPNIPSHSSTHTTLPAPSIIVWSEVSGLISALCELAELVTGAGAGTDTILQNIARGQL